MNHGPYQPQIKKGELLLKNAVIKNKQTKNPVLLTFQTYCTGHMVDMTFLFSMR